MYGGPYMAPPLLRWCRARQPRTRGALPLSCLLLLPGARTACFFPSRSGPSAPAGEDFVHRSPALTVSPLALGLEIWPCLLDVVLGNLLAWGSCGELYEVLIL